MACTVPFRRTKEGDIRQKFLGTELGDRPISVTVRPGLGVDVRMVIIQC
jgi:hypothetical protein